jgi:chromosome partitioning protein
MSKKIVLFANQKGGVGKTTVCRETGLYLGSLGKKILFIDADPQSNLTNGLIENDKQLGLYDALTDSKYQFKAYSDTVSILSADNRLSGLSKILVGEIDTNTRLKALLEDERFNGFDYIFIDSRPSFDTLTINGMSACSHIIIPMSPAEYTLQGTNDLLESINKVKMNYNPSIQITGIIINAFDCRPVITREIREEIETVFGDRVFKSVLSKTIRIEEAISEKKSVTELENAALQKITREVTEISNELLKRLED